MVSFYIPCYGLRALVDYYRAVVMDPSVLRSYTGTFTAHVGHVFKSRTS